MLITKSSGITVSGDSPMRSRTPDASPMPQPVNPGKLTIWSPTKSSALLNTSLRRAVGSGFWFTSDD